MMMVVVVWNIQQQQHLGPVFPQQINLPLIYSGIVVFPRAVRQLNRPFRTI